ncbi:DUF362 domain-containing protein [candidate division KSB1 bacterium]|nr:DUF362 domain-containing protein [candidate division KSB1 bacterium]
MAIEGHYRNLRVAIAQGEAFYAEQPPFHPHSAYAEYLFQSEIASSANPAYEAVRNCLRMLELDRAHFGGKDWNPLCEVILRGERVVIKPNFVLSRHYEGGELFAIITHPSVLRALVDYAYLALKGEGEIIIADAPQEDCNFTELLERTHLPSLQEFYWHKRRFEIKVLDLRDWWLDRQPHDAANYMARRKKLAGDPAGSVTVNLGRDSKFYGLPQRKQFYGADYNRAETIAHHEGEVQEYVISRTVLNADVVLSAPKLKVHKKVGVTLNAKGLVGINTNKNCIVHYTLGTPPHGGDQFPPALLNAKEEFITKTKRRLHDLLLAQQSPVTDAMYSALAKSWRRVVKPVLGSVADGKTIFDGGNWHGNDSAWRMVSDLMKVILYADKNGVLRDAPQRKVFSVIDGIIGGENNGPLLPEAKRAGVIVAGCNPLAVDIAATRLMGLQWQKLKWIDDLLRTERFGCFVREANEIEIASNQKQFEKMFEHSERLLGFKPHPGWQVFLEIE